MPRKTNKGAKTGKPRGERSKFVRSQPLEMSPAEVQEKAEAIGLAITRNHIYTIRTAMKKEQSGKPVQPPPVPGGRRPVGPSVEARSRTNAHGIPAGVDVSVARLQAAILDVGLVRAEKVFDHLRGNIAAFLQDLPPPMAAARALPAS